MDAIFKAYDNYAAEEMTLEEMQMQRKSPEACRQQREAVLMALDALLNAIAAAKAGGPQDR